MSAWLVALACAAQTIAGRPYHRVALVDLATTRWTHVCVSGPVVYRRKMRDGDWHVTLDDGAAKVVLEIIPALPVSVPSKGDRIEACGISRIDKYHGWPEVHPVERIRIWTGRSR